MLSDELCFSSCDEMFDDGKVSEGDVAFEHFVARSAVQKEPEVRSKKQ